MIFSLSACGGEKKTALSIAGTDVDSEIFTYYLDKVVQRPLDYNLSENPTKSELKDAAIDECKRYLVSNTNFLNGGLSLSASEKVDISQTVNDYWLRFKNHYDKIGVSKQTLTKIFTAQAYEDALFTAEFDKGLSDTQAEEIIKNYFYENYISFRTVCAYYTTANGSEMTQLEKNQLLDSIRALAANAGTDIDKFAETALASGYTLSSSVLLKKGAEGYPEGFYEKVSAQNDNTIQVLTYDECVFIVWKENLKEKGEGVYVNYRSACINDLYYNEYQTKTNEYIETLSVEEEKVVDKIINKLR